MSGSRWLKKRRRRSFLTNESLRKLVPPAKSTQKYINHCPERSPSILRKGLAYFRQIF
jgi:hypothetical protein